MVKTTIALISIVLMMLLVERTVCLQLWMLPGGNEVKRSSAKICVKKQDECAIWLEEPKNKINKWNCPINHKQSFRGGLGIK